MVPKYSAEWWEKVTAQLTGKAGSGERLRSDQIGEMSCAQDEADGSRPDKRAEPLQTWR
jgi:hypothetical protein